MKITTIKSLTWQALIASTLTLSTSHAAVPVDVTSSSNDGNASENTIDNDLSTRWSASGDGEYLQYDLGESLNIESIDIAFYKGDARTATFDVLTSNDSSTWITVFSGIQEESTVEQFTVALTASVGQYVKIVGYGNTSNSWNSITEVDFNTSVIDEPVDPDPVDPAPAEPIVYSASTSDESTNGSAHVIDNDLSTRWSANGDGAWVQLDLASLQTLSAVNIAFYNGDSRSASFDLETSTDGENFSLVLADETSSGDDTQLEVFPLDNVLAQYVRYIGYGNTSNTWNSVTEFNVTATGEVTDPVDPDPVDPDPVDPDPVDPDPVDPDPVDPDPVDPDPVDPDPESQVDDAYTANNTGSVNVTGSTYTATADSLEDVLASASGGDEIIVTGSGEISLKGYSFTSPVLIRAASVGGTTLTNATVTNSNNIALQGFVFGPNNESTLLKIVNSTNIKVLRNLFDHKDITESQTSIVMTQASQNIEIAYNTFRDKNLSDRGEKITGSYIKTQFDDPLMTSNLHIHHNHFDNIAPYLVDGTPAGDSDREVIAMGIADSQDVVTNNVIEYNLFENCDGENEIVTVKTSNNAFRYNTFKNSMGSLSFRLGSYNEAYGNYFYGTDAGTTVDDENYQTGGVRVYGTGHKVYNNYMENLTGISWRRPILIDSGDTSESTGNDSHETSTNIDVYGNTIVDSVGGGIHIGGDNYSNMPTGISITDNIVTSSEGTLFNNVADQSSNTWSGNQAYATGDATAVGGAALSSSEVEVLSTAPSISAPNLLTAADVGTDAP